jgi:hypothetical protein
MTTTHRMRAAIAAALLTLAAGSAAAFTVLEIATRAEALDAGYDALLPKVSQATRTERDGLRAEAADLDTQRIQLETDRATLGACSCDELDALIGEIDSEASAVDDIVEQWSN